MSSAPRVASDALRGAAGARVAAQAKVNLRLRVLAREASGFHQLETLFLRLALADVVTLRRTPGERTLSVTGITDSSSLGPDEKNLAWRAAEAFLASAGLSGGFEIQLEKRIPVGGGLGGGSADAGAVLRILNAIADRPLSEAALMGVAASLGADVPFLASEHAFALGWGRGERLLALTAPPAREVLLMVPPFGVNTASAYGWLAEHGVTNASAEVPVLTVSDLQRWDTLAPLAGNDFERVVAARHPEVARMVESLRAAGCSPAMMSGSGSVVFGVMPERASTALPEGVAGARAILTRSVTRVEPVERLD